MPLNDAVLIEPPTTSEIKKLLYIISKVLNRNLGRLLVLVYSLDYLNESTDSARLYASISIIQNLLSTLNRGIITVGVSNNQKSDLRLTPAQLMESALPISIITGTGLSALGLIASEAVVPYVIPNANSEQIRLATRLYALVNPFWVTLMNVPSALVAIDKGRSDLPIFFRELSSGGLVNLVYFFAFRKFSSQSYIESLTLHAVSGALLGRLFIGNYGDMNLSHFFQQTRGKFRNAYNVIKAGLVEGLLSGVDVFGWILISLVISQQEDPRYLLNQLAQIGFTSTMVDSLVTLFRKEPPSRRLLLSANAVTLAAGVGVGSLLSLMKKADPAPSLYTLTLAPLVVKRVVTQIAMDKAEDPIITNNKIVRSHLAITVLAVGFIFTGYFTDMSSEQIFLFYPLITAGLGILSSLFYLAKGKQSNMVERVAIAPQVGPTLPTETRVLSPAVELGLFAQPRPASPRHHAVVIEKNEHQVGGDTRINCLS